QSHLRECPICALQVEEQTRIDKLTRAALQAERIDTAAIELRIRSRIGAEGAQERTGRRSAVQSARPRWIAFAAAAALIILTVSGGSQYWHWNTFRAYTSIARDHFREVTAQQPREWISDPQQIATLIAQEGVPESVLHGLSANGFHILHA